MTAGSVHDQLLAAAAHVGHAATPGGLHSDAAGVRVHLARAPSAPVPVFFPPVLYLVLQGRKRVLVGGRDITYGPGQVVLLAVDLPAVVEVTRATGDEPYLSLEIPLDLRGLTELIAEMPPRDRVDPEPVAVRPLPAAVLEPALRLVRLISTPDAARVLAPGVKREILFHLLSTPAGDSLRALVVADSMLASIHAVVRGMQDRLALPLRVPELAADAGMSLSSFHRRFKAITGTSPADYHKTLRLHEARRQLNTRGESVASVAAAVGYVSPSQFSRDYKRAFGTAPSQDRPTLAAPRESVQP